MNLWREREDFGFTAVVVLNWEKELPRRGNMRKWLFSSSDRMTVDKVPGLWKMEWINRRKGDFGAAGFPRNLLQYKH